MSDWISVEDRMPEAVGRYLTTNSKIATIHEFNKELGFYYASPCNRITHWMPLPAPPKPI